MDFDFEQHLGAVERSVAALERDGAPLRAITLARSHDTTLDELWDAVTNPERLPRWFLPVTGELRLGGRYQLEGNAGGTITACERPTHLALTWEFGGQVSWVDIRLSAAGAGTRLALTHTAPLTEHWNEYGAGAAGVGWELGVLGLAIHVSDPKAPKIDEAAFAGSVAGKAFMAGSSEGWAEASIAGGEAAAAARAAARRTTAFYSGEPAESR